LCHLASADPDLARHGRRGDESDPGVEPRASDRADDRTGSGVGRPIFPWWYDESSEYYVAKVDFFGWDASPADDGAAMARLMERATPCSAVAQRETRNPCVTK
jgi:hypothetical protein